MDPLAAWGGAPLWRSRPATSRASALSHPGRLRPVLTYCGAVSGGASWPQQSRVTLGASRAQSVCTVEQMSACLLKGEFVLCAAVQPQRPHRKIGLNLTPELLPCSPHSWSRACRPALGFTACRSAASRCFVPVCLASHCLSSLLNAGCDVRLIS